MKKRNRRINYNAPFWQGLKVIFYLFSIACAVFTLWALYIIMWAMMGC